MVSCYKISSRQIRHSISIGWAVLQGLPVVLMSGRETSMQVTEDYGDTT